jgi:Predicted drug exporters of the RND superfamily
MNARGRSRTAVASDIKQFGIGLAAGIIFDATAIRALLVPALMRLLDRWNWWLPDTAARLLLIRPGQNTGTDEGAHSRSSAPNDEGRQHPDPVDRFSRAFGELAAGTAQASSR